MSPDKASHPQCLHLLSINEVQSFQVYLDFFFLSDLLVLLCELKKQNEKHHEVPALKEVAVFLKKRRIFMKLLLVTPHRMQWLKVCVCVCEIDKMEEVSMGSSFKKGNGKARMRSWCRMRDVKRVCRRGGAGGIWGNCCLSPVPLE